MRHYIMRSTIVLLALGLLAGCSRIEVTSEPPGAAITYSYAGVSPWKPWPPDVQQQALTPAAEWTEPDPYYYVRVEKEGFFPTRPAFLKVGPLHQQKVHFELEPTPELFAEMQRARGLVSYQGRWVRPEDENLVEFKGEWMKPDEKFRREQIAKGLVLFEPEKRWVTPTEFEELESARKRAQGLVLVKGEWMSPQDAKIQEDIDREARQALASKEKFEMRIELIGPVFTSGAQLRVADLTGTMLDVLLSGPRSVRTRVEPYNSTTLETMPGTYTLVVLQAENPKAPAGVGTLRLTGKSRYSTTYRGLPGEEPLGMFVPEVGTLPPPLDIKALEPLPGVPDLSAPEVNALDILKGTDLGTSVTLPAPKNIKPPNVLKGTDLGTTATLPAPKNVKPLDILKGTDLSTTATQPAPKNIKPPEKAK